MILYYRTDLELLKVQKKKYLWEKPKSCPVCGSSRIWGHGFVLRYLEGYLEGVWLKRLRCHDCHTVYTIRPHNFFMGFYYSRNTIFESLLNHFKFGYWLKSIPRQNQQYWHNCTKIMALSQSISFPKMESLILKGQITFITKRLKYHEIRSNIDPPYLTLAVKTV